MADYELYFAKTNIFCTFVADYNFVDMKENIIGRKNEMMELQRIYDSGKSEFVAVCGRRRVGKTFLIREFFEDEMVFQTAGLANEKTTQQIKSFYTDLVDYGLQPQKEIPNDWIDAFSLLRTLIKKSESPRKVILLDELPWMDTPRSKFISALEHFWNSWASARRDIVLIVCGSATSWMMDKLINNHGGLYNRLTHKIFLHQFTLLECEDFLKTRGHKFSRYEIAECYMIFGGVPYYLDLLDKEKSLSQNIDSLFFKPKAVLSREFPNLYAALFKNSEGYITVVSALCKKRSGLSRKEIIETTGMKSGKGVTTILDNLESCGFIRAYNQFGESKRSGKIYQLVDFFTLFYFNFIIKKQIYSWSDLQGKAIFYSWAGLSFEILAIQHIFQIKKQLGISGVNSREYTWRCEDENKDAQIDLVIERADNTVNLCEMKFSVGQFSIDKDYESNLRNKLSKFVEHTKMKKSIRLTLITTYGLKGNQYSGVASNQIKLDDMFC